MCKDGGKSASAFMTAIEPTIKTLLTVTGIIDTPEGQEAITAYDAAVKVVAAWVPGTEAQDVVQAVTAADQVFDALPVPAEFKMFADIIAGGFASVIGIIAANSPAPEAAAAPDATTAAHVQTFHAHAVAASTEAKVEALTGYKPSLMDKARVAVGDHDLIPKRYLETWQKAVNSDPKFAALAV